MYWTALKMSWRVWIVFQYINLNYIPRQVTNSLAPVVERLDDAIHQIDHYSVDSVIHPLNHWSLKLHLA